MDGNTKWVRRVQIFFSIVIGLICLPITFLISSLCSDSELHYLWKNKENIRFETIEEQFPSDTKPCIMPKNLKIQKMETKYLFHFWGYEHEVVMYTDYSFEEWNTFFDGILSKDTGTIRSYEEKKSAREKYGYEFYYDKQRNALVIDNLELFQYVENNGKYQNGYFIFMTCIRFLIAIMLILIPWYLTILYHILTRKEKRREARSVKIEGNCIGSYCDE